MSPPPLCYSNFRLIYVNGEAWRRALASTQTNCHQTTTTGANSGNWNIPVSQVLLVGNWIRQGFRHVGKPPHGTGYLGQPGFAEICTPWCCNQPEPQNLWIPPHPVIFHHCLFCNMPWTQEVAVQARLRGRRLHCAASMRKAIGRAKWLQVGRCGHCIFGIAFSAPFLRYPFQRFLVWFAHFDSCLRACALVPMGLGEDLFPDFIGFSSHALQHSLCNSSFWLEDARSINVQANQCRKPWRSLHQVIKELIWRGFCYSRHDCRTVYLSRIFFSPCTAYNCHPFLRCYPSPNTNFYI